MWKKFIRDYFTFTRKERNGLIVLLFLIFVVILWPSVYGWFHKDDPPDFRDFQAEIDSFQRKLSKADAQFAGDSAGYVLPEFESSTSSREGSQNAITLFPFDPNTVSAADLAKLGLKEKTIRTILNYRSKGGRFFDKEDFKKIYGLKAEDFDRLSSYIRIESEIKVPKNAFEKAEYGKSNPVKALLELNGADSIELTAINGIGAVLSSRILKFRNRLGGFVDIEQLKEVYGLKPETFEQIAGQVSVDGNAISKIEINTVKLEVLKQHPYFKNPLASTLISYREAHGDFHTPEDLKNVDAITDSVFEKITPYLKF
jgi:DNA uptake protein ComE-like DNA-binding protein